MQFEENPFKRSYTIFFSSVDKRLRVFRNLKFFPRFLRWIFHRIDTLPSLQRNKSFREINKDTKRCGSLVIKVGASVR